MNKSISKDFLRHENALDDIILNYAVKGEAFGNQKRNSLRLFNLDGYVINVKSFKVPNFINQVVYSFFRKSKAQRSFEHAQKLESLQIGTPKPIAFYEFKSFGLFKKSYYLSAHLECDFTYRELKHFSINESEEILRAFTRFTYNLHENNILFLDHSPGNTLIKKVGDEYDFFLVDLNRMQFKSLDFNSRINNFSRLTTSIPMIEIMSDEYAKCFGVDYKSVYDLMLMAVNKFQETHLRKQKLKKQLKFWK